MSSSILFAFALCLIVVTGNPIFPTSDDVQSRDHKRSEPVYERGSVLEKRQAEVTGSDGQELDHGNTPSAKDSIVIEISKPVLHYFAAEGHQDSPATSEESE